MEILLVKLHITVGVPLGEVEIQEFDKVGSYMVDIVDIIISGKEILFDISFS